MTDKKQRNPYVLPMTLRHKSQTFKDKRTNRGGSTNKFQDLLDEYEEEISELSEKDKKSKED